MTDYTEDQLSRLRDAVGVARGDRNWTQKDLADASGLSFRTVQSIEQGRTAGIRVTSIAKLRKVFGWTPEQFRQIVNGDGPETTPSPEEQIIQGTEDRIGRKLSAADRALVLRALDAIFDDTATAADSSG